MRNEGILKILLIIAIGLAVLMVLNIFVIKTVRRQYAVEESARASFFNFVGGTKEWFGYFKKWKDLAEENNRLNELADNYISTKATLESLRIENEILRKTVGLQTRLKKNLVPAGIFNISLSSEGYHASINKGSNDGMSVGQTVISTTNELVGRVITVFDTSSKVVLISDPSFSVTGRVLDGETSGIIHGALANGLDFDLVTQSDEIIEGNTIVTTGNDMVPDGLVIGVVRRVENNDTQIFKKINVLPSAQINQGSVIIIQ